MAAISRDDFSFATQEPREVSCQTVEGPYLLPEYRKRQELQNYILKKVVIGSKDTYKEVKKKTINKRRCAL